MFVRLALLVVAALAVVAGAYLITPPLALVVGGVLVGLVALLVDDGEPRR